MEFDSDTRSLKINRDCTVVYINGEAHSVVKVNLFTTDKGRIFTEIYQIKYSKGVAYIFENGQLIDTLDKRTSPGLGQKENVKVFTRNDNVVSKTFFISKYLPLLIFNFDPVSKNGNIIYGGDDYSIAKTYKQGNHYTVYECPIGNLYISSNSVPCKFDGIAISEIL